jgi:hypothetical protein
MAPGWVWVGLAKEKRSPGFRGSRASVKLLSSHSMG